MRKGAFAASPGRSWIDLSWTWTPLRTFPFLAFMPPPPPPLAAAHALLDANFL